MTTAILDAKSTKPKKTQTDAETDVETDVKAEASEETPNPVSDATEAETGSQPSAPRVAHDYTKLPKGKLATMPRHFEVKPKKERIAELATKYYQPPKDYLDCETRAEESWKGLVPRIIALGYYGGQTIVAERSKPQRWGQWQVGLRSGTTIDAEDVFSYRIGIATGKGEPDPSLTRKYFRIFDLVERLVDAKVYPDKQHAIAALKDKVRNTSLLVAIVDRFRSLSDSELSEAIDATQTMRVVKWRETFGKPKTSEEIDRDAERRVKGFCTWLTSNPTEARVMYVLNTCREIVAGSHNPFGADTDATDVFSHCLDSAPDADGADEPESKADLDE